MLGALEEPEAPTLDMMKVLDEREGIVVSECRGAITVRNGRPITAAEVALGIKQQNDAG